MNFLPDSYQRQYIIGDFHYQPVMDTWLKVVLSALRSKLDSQWIQHGLFGVSRSIETAL